MCKNGECPWPFPFNSPSDVTVRDESFSDSSPANNAARQEISNPHPTTSQTEDTMSVSLPVQGSDSRLVLSPSLSNSDQPVVIRAGADPTECPTCNSFLETGPKAVNFSINLSDMSVLVDCMVCGVRVKVKGALDERQRAFFSCGM
eukprot:GFUD01020727.1.p1 GENE.GFUD01020727.1~~GFUD01020727.1.p1  ORF type:complete len:166 (+),score=47.67 GFUD01020727.1:61-498(+)